jgi:hypothetical protein
MNRESRPKSRRAFRSARGLHHHFDRSEWQQYAGRHPSIPVNSVAEFVAREPIQYALETDWPVGAAGFEPLHLEIRSAELHPA